MVSNLGAEVWAITAGIDMRCLTGNCCTLSDYYMDAVVITRAGSEQVQTLQRAPTDITPRFEAQLEIKYAALFRQRAEQMTKLHWSPLRVAWLGAVIKATFFHP
jgi:hypothetical protein